MIRKLSSLVLGHAFVSLAAIITCGSSVVAQTLSDRSITQQRIVETVYQYKVTAYKENPLDTIDAKFSSSKVDTPERLLAEYFLRGSSGDTLAAETLWDERGRKLIAKRNAGVSPSELSASMVKLHKGMSFRFVERMDANDYVVIRIEKRAARSAEKELDWYALRREGGKWRLTQDLADDPIACCFHEETKRVQRFGKIGGDFRQALDYLLR